MLNTRYIDESGVERYRYGIGERVKEPVEGFRDDVNMVVEGYIRRISYAEAIGVLFGIATDLVREAREEAEKKE